MAVPQPPNTPASMARVSCSISKEKRGNPVSGCRAFSCFRLEGLEVEAAAELQRTRTLCRGVGRAKAGDIPEGASGHGCVGVVEPRVVEHVKRNRPDRQESGFRLGLEIDWGLRP